MILFRNHFRGLVQLLFGDGTRRIRAERPLELARSPLQIASFSQLQAALYVELSGLESRLVQPDFVSGVVGIGFDRLLVVGEGCVVILKVRCLIALIILAVPFRTAGGEQAETDTQD